MTNKSYILGVVILTIHFFACVLNFWFLVYLIPVFIIGVVLVFLSKVAFKLKIITVLTPIVVYFILAKLFFSMLDGLNPTPKEYLIRSDLEGPIRIIYNEPNGIKISGSERQVLKIPDSRILIISEEIKGGEDIIFNLIDKFYKKVRLPIIIEKKENKQHLPCIIFRDLVTLPDTKTKIGISQEMVYAEYYIFNKDTTLNQKLIQKQVLDSLTIQLIRKCRQAK